MLITVASINGQQRLQIKAVRTGTAPQIDGSLDDFVWQAAAIATNFVTVEPNVGEQPRFKTVVKVLYDNDAIYFGATMYDSHPDSILRQLGTRDAGENNSDLIWIGIDSYNDKQNFFVFGISASNVQTDGKFTIENEDFIYDAVWDSRTKITDNAWVAEVRIPYSAFRFKESENQTWGLNFVRSVRRFREQYTWSPSDPNINGQASQFGELTDIKDIKAPFRLTLTPYISTYITHYPLNIPESSNWGKSIRGGLDLKYGINESFTLDMTMIPDFGQVKSDNEVLNLSPFETMYDENRPFFTEGIDLFNKAGIFYSRRIGGRPVGFDDANAHIGKGEIMKQNPSESQLINATKISGRTSGNLGIGIFNAVSANTYAIIEDTATLQTRQFRTQPLTNYNVFVLDQSLKNNSYLTFTNTYVRRQGYYEDADVSAINFKIRDKTNHYEVSGSTALSQNNLGGTDSASAAEKGMKYIWKLAKVSGKFQLGFEQSMESAQYDPNDLGFLYNNNELSNDLFFVYNQNEPQGIFQNYGGELHIKSEQLYKPRLFASAGAFGWVYGTFKNYLTAGLHAGYYPFNGFDYYEPRVLGTKFLLPPYVSVGGFISTDYRKKFALDVEYGNEFVRQYHTRKFNINLRPRIRFNDRFSLYPDLSYNINKNEKGFADVDTAGRILFGNRDRTTISHSLSASYIFTSRMGLGIDVRHYWSSVVYNQYYELQADGKLMDVEDNPAADVNFNAFTIDMTYSWEFTPGSELSLVWKNQIYNSNPADSYFNNLGETIRSDQSNSFSLKVLYYLDYEAIRRHKNRS